MEIYVGTRTAIAIPWPPPMQRAAIPLVLAILRSPCKSVTKTRAPEAIDHKQIVERKTSTIKCEKAY